mmetsp:Transcript_114604/g.329221  ORF Transcript_114604/g.329221 Transcript_114604/m.329221 type:complete len:335 (-) Transcript_114604:1045-2049(-)
MSPNWPSLGAARSSFRISSCNRTTSLCSTSSRCCNSSTFALDAFASRCHRARSVSISCRIFSSASRARASSAATRWEASSGVSPAPRPERLSKWSWYFFVSAERARDRSSSCFNCRCKVSISSAQSARARSASPKRSLLRWRSSLTSRSNVAYLVFKASRSAAAFVCSCVALSNFDFHSSPVVFNASASALAISMSAAAFRAFSSASACAADNSVLFAPSEDRRSATSLVNCSTDASRRCSPWRAFSKASSVLVCCSRAAATSSRSFANSSSLAFRSASWVATMVFHVSALSMCSRLLSSATRKRCSNRATSGAPQESSAKSADEPPASPPGPL